MTHSWGSVGRVVVVAAFNLWVLVWGLTGKHSGRNVDVGFAKESDVLRFRQPSSHISKSY